ncbi:DUF5065 family protein [Bacillus toyonensis]|uniref:DUF5065 family protein n=1 Tax=Bacillus thuringiensis TaxID=1428 RepID=UPI001BCD4110|nr:DUF5065 family protein [Bacillus toyonensis]
MNKLCSYALVGALTFSGLIVLDSKLPDKARAEVHAIQAASPVLDDWQWQTYFLLHHNANYLQELAPGTLKQGGTFDTTVYTGGKDVGVVKIYRLNENGELQRYKTISAGEAGNHYYSRFTTPITTVYTPGTYVAVLKVDTSYYYGGSFQITK